MRRIPRSVVHLVVAGLLAGLMLGLGLATAGADETGPTGDHLVVSRMPTGSTAQAITIVRFNGAGSSDGGNWSLPTTKSGSNNPITLQGDSNAVGALARSADGRYVTLAGYTTAVGGNAEAADPRDVARIDALGNVDTSTVLGTTFEKEKIRGAVSSDGGQFWVTGNGNGTAPLGGMVYATKGSSSPTIIVSKEAPVSNSNKALNNFRSVQIAGGNLYMGSEKGTAGVYGLTGLPTKATSPTNLINLGTTEVDPICELPLEHELGSGKVDLMYVVRENEGIYKYSLSGSTWTERGKVASGSFSGVTGKVDSEGHFRLYAISGYGAANSIVTLTDNAAFNAAPSASATTTVSTAAAGTAYRGVAFAPEEEKGASTVPGTPTEVSATGGNAKATLSWTAPSDGGSPIAGYKVTPFISGVAQSPATAPSATTTYTVEGLTNGTAYTFTVAAINANGTGTASSQSNSVTPSGGAATPTISLSDESLSGTIGDPGNPTVDVTVGQTGVEASALTVAATASSNSSVAAVGGVSVTGSGATRTVSMTPAGGVGFANITLKVTGNEGKSTTTTLHYGASQNIANPSTAHWHTFASDASTAIDVGGGYMLLGNDENNVIRMYNRNVSGAPVKTWDFNSQMGSPEEIDIEAAAQVGNTIYWTGSMGNSKKGNLKPDRSILFTTKVSGSGAATELSFGGYYRGLRADLIKWDEEHGNRFGFASGAASGNIPKQINGFNAEGMEFAAGSPTSGYIGFRAPLSPASAGGKAIVVPVTNLGNLATSGQNTSLHATFGEPLLWNLGGLSIREMRRNASGEYLIIAGSWAATGSQALYVWDGKAADQPVKALTSIGAAEGTGDEGGAWEGIVNITDPLSSGDDIQLVMDDGAVNLYGDGLEAKEEIAEFQKSPTNHFTLLLPSKLTVTKAGSGSGTVTSSPAGIGCGASCESSFDPGTLVKLTGTPAAGSKAVVWSGCDAVNGSNQCEVTVSGATAVTATFDLIPSFQLSVGKAGSGAGTVTSAPAGIDCGPTCAAGYPEGTLVKLTGLPDAGSEAIVWSGCDAVNGSGECEVTVGSARSVTATFELEPVPPKCAATPIDGVGSSLQGRAQEVWIAGLEALCGVSDPVTYEPLGSAAGLAAWDFNGPDGTPFDHSRAFVATDEAPSVGQLANPAAAAGGGSTLAVIPVAQTSIAVVVNPPAGCEIEEITSQQLESVFRGNVKNWGKLDTASGAGCVGKPITRVVRPGGSGTTAQFKSYLSQIDKAALPCTEAPGKTWGDLTPIGAGDQPNTVWPASGVGGCSATQLSPIATAAGNSGAELVAKVNATDGAFGYAALPDVEGTRAGGTHSLKLQNNGVVKLAKATFAEPMVEAGQSANCANALYAVPAAGQVGSGGVGADWSAVSGANTKAGGEDYPLCTLTYDLAFTHYGAAGFGAGQATTASDYLGYIASAAGQLALAESGRWYAPLPTSAAAKYDVLGAARLAASKVGP